MIDLILLEFQLYHPITFLFFIPQKIKRKFKSRKCLAPFVLMLRGVVQPNFRKKFGFCLNQQPYSSAPKGDWDKIPSFHSKYKRRSKCLFSLFCLEMGTKILFLGITFFRFGGVCVRVSKCVFKSLLLALRSRLFLAKSDILVRKCIERAGRERGGQQFRKYS